MNILGQNFDTWVTNQVNFRQKSLGLGSGRSAKDLQYQQSKTPWVRLASSVDLYEDEGGGIDILNRLSSLEGVKRTDIEGNNAARNFILQGGVVYLEGWSIQ